jgi:hypothetical protein
MPIKLQEKAMADSVEARHLVVRVPMECALICAVALGFDLLTDRSFGASMLAVLPVSLLSLAVATRGGFVAGAIAPFVPGGVLGAAAWGGVSNVGQYAVGSTIKG